MGTANRHLGWPALANAAISLFSWGLLLWYLMRWWPGDQVLFVRMLNYLTPWVLAILILMQIWRWIGCRSRGQSPLLIVLTLLVGLPQLPLFLPRLGWGLGQEGAALPFRVMSYSVCSSNSDYQAIMEVIRQARPDLLLLQEIRPDLARVLRLELVDLHGRNAHEKDETHIAYAADVEQMVISRFPLEPLAVVPNQGRVQKVRVEMPEGAFEVWNVHTLQPEILRQEYNLQARQFRALEKAIRDSAGPLLVGGDFNTTVQAELYGLIARHLQNAHQTAGWGFGFSFPSSSMKPDCRPTQKTSFFLPLIRIDHLFASSHFTIHRAQTLTHSGSSDHLPITAELSLK